MQINLIHCGEYGLPSNTEECKKELINNPEKNIEIGAKILNQYYHSYGEGIEFNGCGKVKDYEGWEAALRGYNGLGCGCDTTRQTINSDNKCELKNKEIGEIKYGVKVYSQDNFVEEVMRRYNILKGSYLEKEKSTGILWWKKTTVDFSVEYKSSS
jgi:hypothetical protein